MIYFFSQQEKEIDVSKILKANIDKLQEIIEDEDMVYKVKEDHYKSRALKDVEDETRIEEASLEYDFKVEDSLYLLNELVEEKMRLSMRINDAKEKMRVDWKEDGQSLSLDSALEYSKNLREMARDYFESLCYKRSEEYIKNGLGYLINQEGNQTPYNYELKVVKTINYDSLEDLMQKFKSQN